MCVCGGRDYKAISHYIRSKWAASEDILKKDNTETCKIQAYTQSETLLKKTEWT